MKNKIITFSIICLLFSLSACQNKKTLDEMTIKNICNLATLKVEYNNVAKITKEGVSVFKREKKAWVEYKGIVKLGIDMTKVKISFDDDNVTITMPQVEVIEKDIVDESYTDASWTFSDNDFFNFNQITPEEKSQAMAIAQDNMEATVASDTALLNQAQNRARILIENYINQLGKLTNKNYTITWKEVE